MVVMQPPVPADVEPLVVAVELPVVEPPVDVEPLVVVELPLVVDPPLVPALVVVEPPFEQAIRGSNEASAMATAVRFR
jgi:hypothetical protein